MPTKSARAIKSPTTSKPTAKSRKTAPSMDRFPFAQYASVLGVHLSLIGFTALYLPQTTRFFAPLAPRKTDRPQSEFMEVLTADPSLTLCWISLGLTLLEVWWANWMRKWSFEQTAKGTEIEIRFDRVKFDGLRFTVREYMLGDWVGFTHATVLEIKGCDCAHLVCCPGNTRRCRRVWCPSRNVSAPVLYLGITTELSWSHILQTALLAFVIAILTVFTPSFVLGLPSWTSNTPSMINRLTWTRLFAELS